MCFVKDGVNGVDFYQGLDYVLVEWVTVRRMYNVYNRIQTNIGPI